MKRVRRFLFLTAGILSILIILENRSMIKYGLHLAKGQWQVISKTHPIEEALVSSHYTQREKENLREIARICRFARERLGLETGENYTGVYDQKGEPILWAVTACPAFSLEQHTWHYPLLGDMAYRGFFDRGMAEEEVTRCHDLGMDASAGKIRAWSTLGWFNDPVLSSMLDLEKGPLAELILHELTHRNIFLEDSSSFNENVASFVGVEGALKYLQIQGDSACIARYQSRLSDREMYLSFMTCAAHRIDSLYHHFPSGLDTVGRTHLKAKYMQMIVLEFDSLPFQNDTAFVLDTHPDNTLFSDFLLYHGQDRRLHQLCLEKGGLAQMIGSMIQPD